MNVTPYFVSKQPKMEIKIEAPQFSNAEVLDLITANKMLETVVETLKSENAALKAQLVEQGEAEKERALAASPSGYACVMPFLYKGKRIETKDLTDDLVAELLAMPAYAGCLVKL
jgi:hypothetical protein